MRAQRLPRVCVMTGEPTEDSLRFRFSTSPAWTLLLLLAGLIPYVIAAMATAKRAEGQLPLVRRKHPGVRLLRWGGWSAIGIAILTFFVAAIVGTNNDNEGLRTASGLLFLVSLLLLVAGLLAVILRGFMGIGGRVEGVPGVPDNWVTLRGVHPAFADAVLRMYAERATQAPQPVYAAPQPNAPPIHQPIAAASPPPPDAPLPPPYLGPR